MGGFALGDVNDPKFKELLVRWCQFSCFSPVMRNHGYRLGIQPDGSMDETITAADGSLRDPSGVDNEPWSYGTAIEQVLVKYINIRERMRPYTRELFDSAHQDGQPLIRGLFYEFPEDAKAHSISDEYMFGPDLLVAPVVEYSARNRTVYLPGDASTSWTDLHTGASLYRRHLSHGGRSTGCHSSICQEWQRSRSRERHLAFAAFNKTELSSFLSTSCLCDTYHVTYRTNHAFQQLLIDILGHSFF